MTKDNLSCRPGTTDAMQCLADENEALRARVERLTHCAKESQTWNWISAQEAGFEQAMDRYDIDDMQELHEIAHDETPAQSTAHIRAAGARELMERAMQPKGFSGTVVRVDLLQKIISRMEKNV